MAELVASAIGCARHADERLNAISAGGLAGISEERGKEIEPTFAKSLELYRSGVYNSYRLTGYGEDVREFERRVHESVSELLSANYRVIVVIAHRSSVTAALIRLARLSLGYPKNFYGYIPLDLGHLSAVIHRPNEMLWLGVNLAPFELIGRLNAIDDGGLINEMNVSG